MKPAIRIKAGPWPEIVMRSFAISEADSTQSYNGSWNRLLHIIFPVDSKFEVDVIPSRPVTEHEPLEPPSLYVCVDATPVFIIILKQPTDFHLSSKREEADAQMRRRLVDIATDMPVNIPVLHGVSVFGSKMAFYKYSPNTRRMEPERIIPEPGLGMDTAPREWWALDILEEDGAKRFRDVVEEVKGMCDQLSL